MRCLKNSVLIVALWFYPTLAHADVEPKVRIDEDGFHCHRVKSAYQAGTTEIRVLLPDRMEKDKRYPVIFVLPVEPGGGTRYGNGLREIKKHDLHNKFGVICVEVTFSHWPWYADHPTDRAIRQETYFLKVVLPFILEHYPVMRERSGRLLLGFSKSGWGAFSLLLRHPDIFGKALAWDAPLMMAQPNKFGMKEIFATQENFEKYHVASLLEQRAKELGKEPRLAILGYSAFREHHQQAHELLQRLGIPHEYRDAKKSPHSWDSGWVDEGVRWLMTGK